MHKTISSASKNIHLKVRLQYLQKKDLSPEIGSVETIYKCIGVILCQMNQKNWKSQPTISDFPQMS